jgi:hypothetical protein
MKYMGLKYYSRRGVLTWTHASIFSMTTWLKEISLKV